MPYQLRLCISIHAPRVGCDIPLRGFHRGTCYFNPRTPGGVRLRVITDRVYYVYISIHAPRVGCDALLTVCPQTKVVFQSTHPGWGATRRSLVKSPRTKISIHAPRVGCDIGWLQHMSLRCKFQSTHPGWGATAKVHKRRNGFYVLLRIFFHLCIKTIIFGAMLVCKPGKNLA